MEADDDIHANDGEDSSRSRPIICGEQLDIEAYAGSYIGWTKIKRLIFIADHCGNPSMRLKALMIAYDAIKKTGDTRLFREVVQKKIDGRLGPNYAMDNSWCEMVDRSAEQRKEKLEEELNFYLTWENKRLGCSYLGDFYYARGALDDAFDSYIRADEYCTRPQHTIELCMNVILVSIEMGQFAHVTRYVSKAEQTPAALDPIPMTKARLRCAAGLAHLEDKKYKLAARKFLEVSPEVGNSYNEVITSQDVATYGGLCALASFDRTELKNKVIDNINFRNILELVPEMRELIHDFYSSRYASCLDYLENLKTNLLLDIHLHDHVETLYGQIRSKALIQYTHPFLSVDLNMMANAFKTSVAGLEKELAALITDNQIQARIDSHNKIMYARHADQRKATLVKVKSKLLQSTFLSTADGECDPILVISASEFSVYPSEHDDKLIESFNIKPDGQGSDSSDTSALPITMQLDNLKLAIVPKFLESASDDNDTVIVEVSEEPKVITFGIENKPGPQLKLSYDVVDFELGRAMEKDSNATVTLASRDFLMGCKVLADAIDVDPFKSPPRDD